MSRSNGSGAPPQGWQPEHRFAEPEPDYRDDPRAPQRQQNSAQHPQAQTTQPGRAPRIQTAAPSRVPQTGLPTGGLANQGYIQPTNAYGEQAYAQNSPAAGYPSRPNQPPQYAPATQQQGAQGRPQPQPFDVSAYAPANLPHADPYQRASAQTQAPNQTYAPAAQPPSYRPVDPRYGEYANEYPPAYTPPPSLSAQSAFGQPSPSQAYIPETTQRPTRPPERTAPPQQQNWLPQGTPQNDPRDYDLGNYMPSGEQRAQSEQSYEQPHGERGPFGGLDTFDARDHQGFGDTAHTTSGQDDGYDDADDQDDYDEPRQKTRYGLIAASLIAAITIGGGLAYGYKMFVGTPTQLAATPVVKSGSNPVKVKPLDPGGTKFANTNSKMMEQLSTDRPNDGDGGPKVVKTITIDPYANQPPGPTASLNGGERASTVGVPGMLVEGGRSQALAASPPPPQTTSALPTPPPARPPQRLAAATPPPAPAAYPPAAAPEPAQAPVAPAAPKKPVPLAKKPATPPSAVGGPKGTSGFVAVLASVPASESSRVQAMQQYADLQQKFGEVLGSRAPDVVEAKLEKGTFHRLIVGPPASRDSATGVCTQLKAAGYTADCWVTAF